MTTKLDRARAALTPSTPVGYRIVTGSGRRIRAWPLGFRSQERAEAFLTTMRIARPSLTGTVEPIYSAALMARGGRVATLVTQLEPQGNRTYRAPSRSEPGTYRTVWADPHGSLHCDCTAGASGSVCDHLLAAYRYEEAQNDAR